MNGTQKYRRTKKGILTNLYSKHKSRKEVYYQLWELHAKFLNDKKFHRLFNEWVKSNYDKQFKPSVDRINYKEPYTLRNIQCMSWSDNRYKQRMEMKSIRARTVYMIKGNHIVNVFPSQRLAVMKSGLNQSGISYCLTGKRNTCGGYKWSYDNPENANIHES